MPTYEYEFLGGEELVFATHKSADGSTLVGRPGETVDAAEAVFHPLLRPVSDEARKEAEYAASGRTEEAAEPPAPKPPRAPKPQKTAPEPGVPDTSASTETGLPSDQEE